MKSGDKFGRLTAIEFVEKDKNKNPKWLFRCECGNNKIIYCKSVIQGSTRSCGCYKTESNKNRHNFKHNSSKTRMYRIWHHMKERCNKQYNKFYKDYGGRGVSFCDEWNDFESFKKWALKNGYSDNLTIDRIDSNGNYEPNNCRWVDKYVQANNKRNNFIIEAFGEKHTVAEWSRIKGINQGTLYSRMYRGKMTAEDALTKGVV